MGVDSEQDIPENMIRFAVGPKGGPVRKYTVKKSRLMSVSNVFKEIVSHLPPDSEEEIIVEDFSPKAFKSMLRFIHNKPVMLDSWELAMEMFHLSVSYEIPRLQNWCGKYFVAKTIKPSEVIRLYEMATELNMPEVQYSCYVVMKKGLEEAISSADFEEAKPHTVNAILNSCEHLSHKVLLAVVKWGQHECGRRGISCTPNNVKKCVSEVGKSARLPRICEVIGKLSNLKQLKLCQPKIADEPLHFKRRTLVPVPYKATMSLCSIDIPLSHVENDQNKIQSVFKTDVICELKISVLDGALDLTGMMLQLRNKVSLTPNRPILVESMQVFYSVTRQSEQLLQFEDQVDWVAGQYLEIHFDRSMRLWKEKCAVINVRIEDLEPYRCLTIENEHQEVYDKLKGIKLSLDFRNNQMMRGRSKVPFFIERIFYNE